MVTAPELARQGHLGLGHRDRRSTRVPAVFRLSLLALCLLITEVQGSRGVLPWLAGLLVLATFTFRTEGDVRSHVVIAIEVAFTCLAVTQTHGPTSPLLAYLPAPILAAGVRHGWTYAVVYGGESALLLIVGRTLRGSVDGPWHSFTAEAAQWVVLSVAIGVLADRMRRLPRDDHSQADAFYQEALDLIGQLRDVTRQLPGSLNPVAVAEGLLETCAKLVKFDKSAVLVHVGEDRLAPLATRGMQRVPWPHPLKTAGPLQRAWRDRRPVLDVRSADNPGRRRGSALLAIPISAGQHVVGLVVVESADLDAFSQSDIAALTEAVGRRALRLGTAVVFDEFRAYASVEERERLAREMQDGVGQDLAYIGFELDDLQHRLTAGDRDVSAELASLRTRVNDMLRDIRLSITSLQSGVELERGLGAALTSHVRAAAVGGGFSVHLTLEESTFRLPADTEAELLRIAQEVTAAARRRHEAQNLWVTLVVDPPAAELRMEHDGQNLGSFPDNDALLRERVQRIGGRLRIARPEPSRVSLEVTLTEALRPAA